MIAVVVVVRTVDIRNVVVVVVLVLVKMMLDNQINTGYDRC